MAEVVVTNNWNELTKEEQEDLQWDFAKCMAENMDKLVIRKEKTA